MTKNKFVRIPLMFISKYLGRYYPEYVARLRYFLRFGKLLNLNNPKTLNEKILYLSLRTDTSEWSRLTDKFNVRKYVEDCGLKEILVRNYAYWRKEDEINFDNLPESFVIKSVQGCGDTIIVKDKTFLEEKLVRRKLNSMLKQITGTTSGEKHYFRIKPAIIVEELLPIKSDFTSLIDYKFWCFNGEPRFILTCSNRFNNGVYLGLYDTEWNYCPNDMIFSKKYPEESSPLDKPQNFEEMLKIAENLSKPFPCVRVDLYNIEGKIYFGEMTFTSMGGMMIYFTDKFQNFAGDMIDLYYKIK